MAKVQGLSARYKLVGVLADRDGRSVRTAQDRLLGTVRVLKLAPDGHPAARALQAEAGHLAARRHPRLVRLTDRFVGLADERGQPVTGFATEWVDGAPLTRALARASLAERLSRFAELVEVVGWLHRTGLLHLDLKPANVLLGAGGVTLLDVGTARPLDAGPGEAGGTLGYAAPEVLRGEAAGVQSDLYSLGSLLYRLLSEAGPFGDLSGSELRQAVLMGDVVPLRAVAPDVPAGLAALVTSLMAVDSARRPDSLEDLATELEQLGGVRPSAPVATAWVERPAVERGLRQRIRAGDRVDLVGPPGSGRTRLLQQLSLEPGLRALDLTEELDPRPALSRLATRAGGQVVADLDDPDWGDATAAAVDRAATLLDFVALAASSRLVPAARRAVASVAQALSGAGVAVLQPVGTARPGRAAVTLPRLRVDEGVALGRQLGVARTVQVQRALAVADGWPGPLLALLGGPTRLPDDLTPAERDAARVLAFLPTGTPHALLDQLPVDLRAGLSSLEERGLFREGPDGAVLAPPLERPASLPDGAREALCEVAEEALAAPPETAGRQSAPHWLAVLLARLDHPAIAALDLRALQHPPLHLVEEVLDVPRAARRLGHPDAWVLDVSLLNSQGNFHAALEVAEAAPPEHPRHRDWRLHLLNRLKRHDEALALVDEILAEERAGGAPTAQELREAVAAAVTVEAVDRAQQALDALLQRADHGLMESGHSLRLAARVAHARWTVRGELAPSRALLPAAEGALARGDLSPVQLGALAKLAERCDRADLGLRLYARATALADRAHSLEAAVGTRLNRGLALQRAGRIAEARQVLADAVRMAERGGLGLLRIQLHYNLARLELQSGRLPDARRQMAGFERAAGDNRHPEIRLRRALNRAWLALLEGDPAGAREVLADTPDEKVQADGLVQRDHLRAWAALELGEPEVVLALLADSRPTTDPGDPALRAALRGRARLALARRDLDEARQLLPGGADAAALRHVQGEVLLAWAGEDQDPDDFPARRDALDRAARLLRGPLAARAVRLRERMLSGPGAALDGIVALTESMNDAQAFPAALARLVQEALGAHRVLIMLRMPGLGNQLGFTELSGGQAAGIGREVMERIQAPDDVWIAGDAFADPAIRESSQTVQTFELKSLLAVAIPRGDRAVGALYVDDMFRAHRFGDDDVAMLQRLARAVGGMLGMVGERRSTQTEHDPVERHGVHLSEPRRIAELERAVSMLGQSEEANLLITGPTGTGKTFLARRLAEEVLGLTGVETVTLRKGDPQMLVTQLMGSRRGEFTGAVDRVGAIERCLRERKVLFLDEIQNLDETGQQILLPLLDLPRTFGGLTGATAPLKGRLHIFLGTNHDVSGARAFDVFRSDLWYRMSRVQVHLPPLADRGSEIVYRYLAAMLTAQGLPAPEHVFQTAALYRVTNAPWPGNLRELSAFAERAAHLFEQEEAAITEEQLGSLQLSNAEGEVLTSSAELDRSGVGATLDDAMIRHVMSCLRRHDWVQSHAAQELGLNPPTLHKFLKRHELLDEVRRRRQDP